MPRIDAAVPPCPPTQSARATRRWRVLRGAGVERAPAAGAALLSARASWLPTPLVSPARRRQRGPHRRGAARPTDILLVGGEADASSRRTAPCATSGLRAAVADRPLRSGRCSTGRTRRSPSARGATAWWSRTRPAPHRWVARTVQLRARPSTIEGRELVTSRCATSVSSAGRRNSTAAYSRMRSGIFQTTPGAVTSPPTRHWRTYG
jgi:hypothetical protein